MTTTMSAQEINEEIERRVFGRHIPTQAQMRECAYRVWREQPGVQFFSDLGGFHVEPVNDVAAARPYNRDDARFVASVPNYWGDVSRAFTILEHFRPRYHIDLSTCLSDSGKSWVCVFVEREGTGDGELPEGSSDKPAEAVCLATLALLHAYPESVSR